MGEGASRLASRASSSAASCGKKILKPNGKRMEDLFVPCVFDAPKVVASEFGALALATRIAAVLIRRVAVLRLWVDLMRPLIAVPLVLFA